MPWKYGTKDSGEPPKDAATEAPSDEDTEGHRRHFRAGEGTDQPPSDESEGHVFKVKG